MNIRVRIRSEREYFTGFAKKTSVRVERDLPTKLLLITSGLLHCTRFTPFATHHKNGR